MPVCVTSDGGYRCVYEKKQAVKKTIVLEKRDS
jgi:hypothetical protein